MPETAAPPAGPTSSAPRPRRIPESFAFEALLALLILATHGYFYNGTGVNHTARFDVIFSFVEPDSADHLSFRINKFMTGPHGPNTIDWARYEDNYYSNKAPGTALLGIPVYFLLYYAERLLGLDPSAVGLRALNLHVLTALIASLWTALSCVALFRFRRSAGTSSVDALFVTLVYAFGTLLFPFDSQLWGHTTAAAFLMLAYCLLFARRGGQAVALYAGLFLGLATMTEYTALVSASIASLYVLLVRSERPRAPSLLLGSLVGLLVTMIYHRVCFGGFFTTATSMSNPVFLDPTRWGGTFGAFDYTVAWKLLFSLDRGIFIYMPVLCMALVGIIQPNRWLPAGLRWLCLANIAAIVSAISCFNGWEGGYTTGARYLIIALPFFGLLLPPLTNLATPARWLFVVLALGSWLNMLVIVSTTPMLPPQPNPLYETAYGDFMNGAFFARKDPMRFFDGMPFAEQGDYLAYNLGIALFRLRGFLSLAPLLALLPPGSIWLFRVARRMDASAPASIGPLPPPGAGGPTEVVAVATPPRGSIARGAAYALLAIPAAMIAYRFMNPDLSAFIADEPAFLRGAREQLISGEWAISSAISGSQGATYGPIPVWLYGLFMLVVGPGVEANIHAMGLLLTACQIWICAAVARMLQGGIAMFATLVALVAASPYFFFYARLAWDPVVAAASAGTVALLCAERPFSIPRSAFIGALLGAAASSHPDSLPFVVIVGLVLLAERVGRPRELLATAVPALTTFAVINIPYLLYLSRRPLPAVAPDRFVFGAIPRLLQVPRVGTAWGAQLFFDDSWGDFVQSLPWPGDLSLAPLISVWALGALMMLGLLAMLARPGPARRVASLALIAWVGHAAFLGWMQLNLWPHYQFATWWIIPVGVAGALDWLRTRLRPLAIGVGGAAWALALAQFLFVVAWMGCIREQGGTRGIYYSATLGELKGAVERICAWPEHQLFVANRTRVFAEALNYLADVNATCAGKSIHVCPFQCQPPPPPGSRGLMLVYGKDKGGTLAVR